MLVAGVYVNITTYADSNCKSVAIHWSLQAPTAACETFSSGTYTSGYPAYSCGATLAGAPTLKPTPAPTVALPVPYLQATSFQLQEYYYTSSSCSSSGGSGYYKDAVGLGQCYRFVFVDYGLISVIYNQVASSSKLYLNYSRTVFLEPSLNCYGSFIVEYLNISKTCVSDRNLNNSAVFSTVSKRPQSSSIYYM